MDIDEELLEEWERQYLHEIDVQTERAEKAEARVKELVAALRPFADDSRWYGHMDGDAVMRDCWPEARDEAKRVLDTGSTAPTDKENQ
jgi:hypothetical protein